MYALYCKVPGGGGTVRARKPSCAYAYRERQEPRHDDRRARARAPARGVHHGRQRALGAPPAGRATASSATAPAPPTSGGCSRPASAPASATSPSTPSPPKTGSAPPTKCQACSASWRGQWRGRRRRSTRTAWVGRPRLARRGAGRISRHWGLAVSQNTLLRLLRRQPIPACATPTVLGVDDFALRKR